MNAEPREVSATSSMTPPAWTAVSDEDQYLLHICALVITQLEEHAE